MLYCCALVIEQKFTYTVIKKKIPLTLLVFCANMQELMLGNIKVFFMKEGKEAVKHLMEVACGLHSMIFGEDQIISQVRNSIEISREENVSGSVLNTLFRYAITSAKEVKSSVYLRSVCPSVAKKSCGTFTR